MIAVISTNGELLGLFTSGVDAHLVAKRTGAAMWECVPNSCDCKEAGRMQAIVFYTGHTAVAGDSVRDHGLPVNTMYSLAVP